jgi:hypothetical protein
MASSTFDAVVLLVEQLTDDEQQALMATVVDKQQDKVSASEWMKRLESVMIASNPGPLYSDSRAAWYDDDDR